MIVCYNKAKRPLPGIYDQAEQKHIRRIIVEFKMKHKGWEIVLCIFTLVLSILSSILGYTFMN